MRRRRCPAFRSPTLGRILHAVAGGSCHDEKCDTEIGERLKDPDTLDEPRGNWRGHECPCSESADGNAGDKPSSVWKPLYQDRDRHNVAEAQSNSADHTIA